MESIILSLKYELLFQNIIGEKTKYTYSFFIPSIKIYLNIHHVISTELCIGWARDLELMRKIYKTLEQNELEVLTYVTKHNF